MCTSLDTTNSLVGNLSENLDLFAFVRPNLKSNGARFVPLDVFPVVIIQANVSIGGNFTVFTSNLRFL